jgi:peptidase E
MYFLCSSFNTNEWFDGVRTPVVIPDNNNFVTNLKKHISAYNRVVIIANNQYDHETTDYRAGIINQSLEITGLDFKQSFVIDSRSKEMAREIIMDADLVMLCGGKIRCQLDLFNEIELKKLIDENQSCVVMGGSAGAMNLCKTVCDFPEDQTDLDGRTNDERFYDGLGYHDEIIIPHFNGDEYGLSEDGLDILNDYILPLSNGREFIAYPDDSYIMTDGTSPQYFGTFYTIRDGVIKKRI